MILKRDFSRGVELLADNVLHPAMPSEAFDIVKQQTSEFLAGRQTSPAYLTDRALRTSLLPARDPGLRDATPETVGTLSLDDVKRYHRATFRPDLTTIVVIGDITAEEARPVIARWFGAWAAAGAAPETDLPRVPSNAPATVVVPDPSAVQSSVALAQEIGITRFDQDYYALQVGNHVLGGGFYATRLYRDLRQGRATSTTSTTASRPIGRGACTP